MAKLTSAKAKMILEDGMVRGKKLTKKQKKFFGAMAHGKMPMMNQKMPMSEKAHRALKMM